MAGKIVSVVNRKGGVGKTTLTLALADTMVGKTELPYDPATALVVVVDLDPQGSLTKALLHEPNTSTPHPRLRLASAEGRTVGAAIAAYLGRDKKPASDFLTHGVGPSGFTYALLANDSKGWDVERKALKTPGEIKLKAAVDLLLRELAREYCYVLVDCPPGQTVIAEAAIQRSDLLLCPVIPDWLSYWALESFDDYIREVCGGERRPPARYVFTQFKLRPPKFDPQNEVASNVEQFSYPEHYVTLLRESGVENFIGSGTVSLPFDTRLVSRLNGTPKPGRIWPWPKLYTDKTRVALQRLVSAMKEELNDGGPGIASTNDGASDRAPSFSTRSDPQVAR